MISRVGENDLFVQIGLVIKFVKFCLFEGKIKVRNDRLSTRATLAINMRYVTSIANYGSSWL